MLKHLVAKAVLWLKVCLDILNFWLKSIRDFTWTILFLKVNLRHLSVLVAISYVNDIGWLVLMIHADFTCIVKLLFALINEPKSILKSLGHFAPQFKIAIYCWLHVNCNTLCHIATELGDRPSFIFLRSKIDYDFCSHFIEFLKLLLLLLSFLHTDILFVFYCSVPILVTIFLFLTVPLIDLNRFWNLWIFNNIILLLFSLFAQHLRLFQSINHLFLFINN